MADLGNVNDPANFEVVWDTPEELERLGLSPDSNKDAETASGEPGDEDD